MIMYFLKSGSSSKGNLRLISGVSPSFASSPATSASAAPPSFPAPAPSYGGAAATFGIDIPFGQGPFEIGKVFAGGTPAGA